MKQMFTVLAAMCMVVFSQEQLTYTEVIEVESVSQNHLYNRAKLWFATAYNSSNDVLQIDNKEDGELIGKALVLYEQTFLSGSAQTKGPINYTIKVFVKEGRYKYEISDFIHNPYGNDYGNKQSFGVITTDKEYSSPKWGQKKWCNRVWNDMKAQIEDNMTLLITDLKEKMIETTETKKDDW